MSEELDAKVLLVDDEEDFCDLLSERLGNRGMKVNTVNSGEDALSKVENESFDAIIVDFSMPGIDGLETLRRIKEKRPDLEIIMLTGHATVQNSIEAMKLGAEDLLEKPVDLQALIEKIKEAKHKRMVVLEKKTSDELKEIMGHKGW